MVKNIPNSFRIKQSLILKTREATARLVQTNEREKLKICNRRKFESFLDIKIYMFTHQATI